MVQFRVVVPTRGAAQKRGCPYPQLEGPRQSVGVACIPPLGGGGLSPYEGGGGGIAHLFVNQESQYQKTDCLMSICCAACRTPLGRRGGGSPHFHFGHGDRRRGARITCDGTRSVLLHIALCMCVAFVVCLHGWAFRPTPHPGPEFSPHANTRHFTERYVSVLCSPHPLLVGVRCQGRLLVLRCNIMRG